MFGALRSPKAIHYFIVGRLQNLLMRAPRLNNHNQNCKEAIDSTTQALGWPKYFPFDHKPCYVTAELQTKSIEMLILLQPCSNPKRSCTNQPSTTKNNPERKNTSDTYRVASVGVQPSTLIFGFVYFEKGANNYRMHIMQRRNQTPGKLKSPKLSQSPSSTGSPPIRTYEIQIECVVVFHPLVTLK